MCSGHSLGAALSLLFAAELHSRHSALAERVAGVYAYASPRVGDAAFAAAFTEVYCNPDRYARSSLPPSQCFSAGSPADKFDRMKQRSGRLQLNAQVQALLWHGAAVQLSL